MPTLPEPNEQIATHSTKSRMLDAERARERLSLYLEETQHNLGEAGNSIQALEILLEGKLHPTYRVNKLREELTKAKKKLADARATYYQIKQQFSSIDESGDQTSMKDEE